MTRYIAVDDFLDLFYVASAGQDKAFIETAEMVVADTPTADVIEVVRRVECKHRIDDEKKYIESAKLENIISDGLNSGKFGHDAVEILSEIYALESADVVEVVRCRDCKHRVEGSKICAHPKAVGWDAIEPEDDDFCSYGERRTEDEVEKA